MADRYERYTFVHTPQGWRVDFDPRAGALWGMLFGLVLAGLGFGFMEGFGRFVVMIFGGLWLAIGARGYRVKRTTILGDPIRSVSEKGDRTLPRSEVAEIRTRPIQFSKKKGRARTIWSVEIPDPASDKPFLHYRFQSEAQARDFAERLAGLLDVTVATERPAGA